MFLGSPKNVDSGKSVAVSGEGVIPRKAGA